MANATLVRWLHPTKGLIYSDYFIGIAEAHGWMEILTNEVLRQAVEPVLIWTKKRYLINISVNVSADNITSLSLPEQIGDFYFSKAVPPLEIERFFQNKKT